MTTGWSGAFGGCFGKGGKALEDLQETVGVLTWPPGDVITFCKSNGTPLEVQTRFLMTFGTSQVKEIPFRVIQRPFLNSL